GRRRGDDGPGEARGGDNEQRQRQPYRAARAPVTARTPGPGEGRSRIAARAAMTGEPRGPHGAAPQKRVSKVAVRLASPLAGTATCQTASSAERRSLGWLCSTMRVSPHSPPWTRSTVTGSPLALVST